jgi:hypothetical protein
VGWARAVSGALAKEGVRWAGHFVPVFMARISHPGFLCSQTVAPFPMALSLRFSGNGDGNVLSSITRGEHMALLQELQQLAFK